MFPFDSFKIFVVFIFSKMFSKFDSPEIVVDWLDLLDSEDHRLMADKLEILNGGNKNITKWIETQRQRMRRETKKRCFGVGKGVIRVAVCVLF